MYQTNVSISSPVKTLVEIDHARACESRSSGKKEVSSMNEVNEFRYRNAHWATISEKEVSV